MFVTMNFMKRPGKAPVFLLDVIGAGTIGTVPSAPPVPSWRRERLRQREFASLAPVGSRHSAAPRADEPLQLREATQLPMTVAHKYRNSNVGF
jgi:hypothetical protein